MTEYLIRTVLIPPSWLYGVGIFFDTYFEPQFVHKSVSFKDIMLKDGCICYSVKSGNCVNAIT